MEDIKRPTAVETDEDLIRQQELFFKNKNKTSVNTKPKEKVTPQEAENFKSSPNQKCSSNLQDEMDVPVLDFSFDIKEQDFSSLEPFVFKAPSVKTVEVINLKGKKVNPSQFSSRSKNQSIFSKLLEKKEDASIHMESSAEVTLASSLVDGSGLATKEKETELQKIHEENMANLFSMSIEEIKQHQAELKSQLDPTLIKFIQSKSKKGKNSSNTLKDLGLKSQHIDNDEMNGEILKKEGRGECDALILEKVMEPKADKDKTLSSTSISKNKNFEIPEETKELLESSDKGQWKNMNKIEKEKLEWISDLPSAKPINLKTGFAARFDFEGKLLAHDIETPTFKGLHHHGEEPEVAGYSLEELFLLARSTLQSQRITALHTIAHILDNYWHGLMDGCFDDPLLPTLLNAGIVPLLRWALDDTSVTSLAATITAIHSLLISKPDEICLQRTFCWLNGHIIPQMKPMDLEEPNIVLEELTDADLIKLDVIKAFLQMDILPRFSYILQVLQPPPLVCKLILEICAHFAQHSVESADQVARYSGLLDFIFKKFLPLKWQFVDGSKLTDSFCYKCPLPSAMKLVRLIVSSSKELALFLVKQHDLFSNLTVYLTLQPSDEKISAEDMQLLMIETIKTYYVLLSYGIGFEFFLDLFSLFLKQMGFCLSLDMSSERSKHLKDFEYATHLFKTFEAVTALAVEQEDQKKSSKAAIKVIFDKALICLKKWLWQFPQQNPSDHGMILLAGCMNFISTYIEKAHHALMTDGKPCGETTSVFQTYLLPCIQSEVFKSLLTSIESYSSLLHAGDSGNHRDSQTIVSLGSILWRGDVVPILKENSPIPLLLAVLRLLIKQKQMLPGTDNASLKELLKDGSIAKYLRKISSEKLNIHGWFARYESYLLSQMLQLPSSMIFDDALLTHKIASLLVLILRTPDESIAEDIFENIIFNPFFLLPIEDETFEELSSNLEVISLCYVTCLLNSEAVLQSRKLLNGDIDVPSLVTSSNAPFLLSKDWFYAPILEKYQGSTKKKCNEQLSPDDCLQLSSCLEWIFLSHKLSLPLVKDIPAAVEFSYLCMLFLLDEDFFRKPEVKKLLEGCLLSILKYKKVKLSKFKWNTLNGFDDLFLEMLIQFEAVSYGDELFGQFLLFPLQQCYPKQWRQLLLTEHSQALCFLRVPLSKLFVPVRSYLEPLETDAKIILEYYKLLSSGALTFVRCPLFYVMAIHHLNHFIFSRHNELKTQQKSLIASILKLKRKDVRKHILLYSEVNVDMDCGITLKSVLSTSDQTYLSNIVEQPINLEA